MGNSFCKLDDAYIVKNKRYFASCLTDPGIGKQIAPTTWEGKCMYHDEAKLKALIEKVRLTKAEPSVAEETAIYVDTGLKCKVTSNADGQQTVTYPGTIPEELQKATLKEGVDVKEANEFEAMYMSIVRQAFRDNTVADLDKSIQKAYNFQTASPAVEESKWSTTSLILIIVLSAIGITTLLLIVWVLISNSMSSTPAAVGGRR